jgi:sulfite reductase (NADPH) hemoprotein beta-component
MYRYDEYDRTFVAERVAQFREQVGRRLSGALSEDEFRPLRLMNGLYLQLHAYMLRVAIPYGTLSARQMRALAHIARRYDRGYGHFTTRQNIQFNWIKLEEAPDALADLALADMHALQTSGNCIRNVTADHFAGVAPGEIEDPRIWCEIIRQWSSLHPEFSFLPRKFKIAVTGSPEDRAAVRVHDIGLRMHRDVHGEVGFEVIIGGGLGRTPMIGKTIRSFLPKRDLLGYLEAILRVYNALGRRDNLFKARIKILVHEIGAEEMAQRVEAEWAGIRAAGALDLPPETVAAIAAHFRAPDYAPAPDATADLAGFALANPGFTRWRKTNVAAHRQRGYAIVTLSLKPPGGAPGDASAAQIDAIATLAESYSLGEIRVSHEQNLILPHVRAADLPRLWLALDALGLATANIGQVTDIIACPGLDYCSLANARSIPVAQRLTRRFADLGRVHEIGALKIKMSGCINACGHHHVGEIGLLGVDKNGEEFYQITLGGSAGPDASLGTIIGPAVASDAVVDAVESLVDTYLGLRRANEPFIDVVRRVGTTPFKERLYAAA